jgi:outer membrane immunogenic protein
MIMRSTALALTIAAGFGLALGQSASAADLYRKAPAMPVPVASAYNWSGFYIGAHVGAGWGQNEVYADEVGGLLATAPNMNGLLGGGQIGFNIQSGSLVWGLELDGSWTDINGTGTTFFPLDGSPFYGNTEASVEWMATATARLGFAFDRTMLYVKGGAAWANFEYSTIASDGDDVSASGSGSHDKWGWIIGAGVEHAFTSNWSAKLEYNYAQFDSDGLALDYSIITTGGGSDSGTYNEVSAKQHVHMVKFGLNYKFSPFNAPISARY